MKVNGKNVSMLFGEPLIDSLKREGIFIPSMCDDPSFMDGENCCRLCLVEVTRDGVTKIVSACETIAREEYEIRTDTEEICKARETVIQLLHAQAPNSLTILNLMKQLGIKSNLMIENKPGMDCILCGRCVRACKYWVKGALSIKGRGIEKRVCIPYDQASDECLGCGTCRLVCPIDTIPLSEIKNKRIIWNKEFEILYCEKCGKKLTTKENYYDAHYADAPVLCNECSEKYRIENRKNEELYCY